MTRACSAGGLRHPAVLAATIGLHVGLFMVIAQGFVPEIRKMIERDEPVFVPVAESKPEPRSEPGDPVVSELHFAPWPEPDIELPEFVEPDAGLIAQAHTETVPNGGSSAAPAPGQYVAASLRTKRDRVNALIDSCYPAAARRNNEEGKAIARVVIGAQGAATSWRMADSSGFPRLDAAVDCVIRRLAFEPARRDGNAVDSEVSLPIVFRLD